MSSETMKPLPPLGLQPIVFGGKYDFAQPDQLDEFLRVVSDAGYASVEILPPDADVFNRLSAKYGVSQGGAHTSISRSTDPFPIIETLNKTGARDVCNSGLLKWGDLAASDYYAAIPILNEMGRAFAREGIRFHYHNHAFEFEVVEDGKTGMDILMSGLDFSVIDLCVDVAWVYRGGEDPAEYLRRYQDRISYLHLKDTDGTDWKELGRGLLDFDSIIAAIREMPNIRWAMVEQDKSVIDPAESCRISRDYLRKQYQY